MSEKNNLKFETAAVRTQFATSAAKEHSVPLYLSSSFIYDDAERMRAAFASENDDFIYSRFSNPNSDELVKKMCLLEGAEAGYATASGMAAVFSSLGALCNSGDEILSCRSIFGSTHTVFTKILPKWNITTNYADANDFANWDKLVTPNTKLLYLETPTNPGVEVLDLEAIGKFCKRHNLIYVVDNCFATPYLQQPIKYGADLVIHSGTKWIDGQGRVVGGVLVGRQNLVDEIYAFCRSTGPAISPFNAWILSKSLETLAVRMDRHCNNALTLANFLEQHSLIERVLYPFLESHPNYEIAKKQMSMGGGIVTVFLKGGLPQGKQFLDSIKLCSLTANIGDSRSIVTHPASTTHAKLSAEERAAVGISDNMIRISCGLEHIDDIIADIEQALQASSL